MKKLFNVFLLAAVALTSMVFASCSSDDDESSTSNSKSIMKLIDDKAFKYYQESFSNGSLNFHYYTYYITFAASSELSGTFAARLDWRDVDAEGTQRGTNLYYGTFKVESGKIKLTNEPGSYFDVKQFKVAGKNLISDRGEIYEPYGNASSVDTHAHPLDYWQRQYNSCITELTKFFINLETYKSVGDKKAAEKCVNDIKNWQASAKNIREAAAKDHWTIAKDPLETKSASV